MKNLQKKTEDVRNEKADEGRKGKVVSERKAVINLALERRNQMPKRERGKTRGEKSNACQAELLVRRAVYV